MDKYDSMSDGELRRAVAERVGWRFATKEAGRTFDGAPVIEWIAIAPGGTRCHSLTAIATTQEAALERYTPNWPQSADAALALWMIETTEINIYPEIDTVTIWPKRGGGNVQVKLTAFTPQAVARALCVAWLRWQDAQEVGE